MPSKAIERTSSVAQATVDLSRARQALLSVAQPALGALVALGALPDGTTMALGLLAATCGYLAVFSLNDVLDRHVDAEALKVGKAEFEGFDLDTAFERHPLARGDLTLSASVVWVGCLAITSAVAAFAIAPICFAFFALAVALEVAYCSLRSVTWTKTVLSGLMVAVGGLAGWVAVAPLSARAIPFFAFLALWEIGGRNLPNDLADLAADSRVGIKTVATVFGPRISAEATAAVSVATLIPLGLLGLPAWATLASLGLGVWALFVPAVALLREPTSAQAGRFFNRASLLPALVFVVALIAVLVA